LGFQRQPGLVAHVHTSPSPAPRSLSSQPTVTFNTPRPLYSNVTRSIPSSHPQHHTTSAPSGPPGYISFPPLPAPSPAPVSRAAAPPPYTVQYQQHQGAAAFDHAGRYVSEQQRWTALKANQPLPRPEGHARTPSGAKSPVAGYFPLSVAAGVRLPRSGEPSPARGAREVPPRMMSGESAEWQGQEVSNSPVEAFGMASGGSMALSANAPAFDLSPVNKLSTSTKLTAPTINSHASPSPGIGFIPEPKTSATDLTYAQVQSAKASFLASLATTLSAQRRFTLADHLADIASARASNQVTTKFHLATFEDEWRLRRVRYEAQAGTVIAVAETLGEVGLGRREVEEVIAEWLRG